MEKIKKIVIEEVDSKITFNTEGFTDIEIMGLLSYYEDWFKIRAINNNNPNEDK